MSYNPLMGRLIPKMRRMHAIPTWDSANVVLPESQWREHDDHADLWPEIEAQLNSNCTNASIAGLGNCAFKLAGVKNVPRFSWSFNYARHNGGQDEGAFCHDVMGDFRFGTGLAPSDMWPDSHIIAYSFPKAVVDEAGKWTALEVYQCMDFASVASALSLGFLVYTGFVLGNGFTDVPSNGKVPEWDGRIANGHAMASRGLTKEFGDWRTITPNTWGTGFGNKGVGYWPKSYFWESRGNTENLEAFAVRSVKRVDKLPTTSA